MKTNTTPLSTMPSHVLRPATKATFAPHQAYSADAMKTMRTLVKDTQDARIGVAPAPSYTVRHGSYDGAELKPYAGRPGATDTDRLPSRVNNRLNWPDGRVTDMAGNPLQSTRSQP